MLGAMTDFDLNLSTQPFPAYRFINIAMLFVLVALAVLSIWQAAGFVRYSEMAGSIRSEEQESRVEAEALAKRVAELESRLDRPESAAKLNEIGFLNHLILRKNLSWTKLFRLLEEMVPENVHFTTLSPDVGANGGVTLNLGVRARSIADMKVFLERVEQSPLFEHVVVTVEEKKDSTVSTDVDVTLSAVYYPQRDTR
jgi:Tfp pilus assembly protein PilN